jgi:hypothetical protein
MTLSALLMLPYAPGRGTVTLNCRQQSVLPEIINCAHVTWWSPLGYSMRSYVGCGGSWCGQSRHRIYTVGVDKPAGGEEGAENIRKLVERMMAGIPAPRLWSDYLLLSWAGLAARVQEKEALMMPHSS